MSERRTVQFLIERSCPHALPSAVLMGLPFVVWVYWPPVDAAIRPSDHEPPIYRITPESAREYGIYSKDGRAPGVCEHMGHLIE